MSKVTIDTLAQAAYLRVEDGEVSKTISISPATNFDFDSSGTLLGIEVLNLNLDTDELAKEISIYEAEPEVANELVQEFITLRTRYLTAKA